ncbi:glycogen synthase [Nonlabens agnitus]|uniref:Glycosyl transferase family 1 n=1 Tax=Nonlabens agnitus TaxID=870484 RepID=A0A2S9WQP1_9FLAO|nr:glycogen synthase [Nonlabens agnitus]PRP65820.1 glycosyl transferase family 1 [Nonlabens agnitus]
MKVLFLTREFPPHVYGGAGVHVEYLARELAQLMQLEVRCFGDQDVEQKNLSVEGYDYEDIAFAKADSQLKGLLQTLSTGVHMNIKPVDADVTHCHTWYSHFAGIMAKLSYGTPLVVTTHSLEPLRPWKRDQLGRGYDASSWIEKTAIEMADAVIAVSKETKDDVLRFFDVDEHKIEVIYNGIDLQQYQKTSSTGALEKYGVDPNKPFVLFVGRITKQKGIIHLVNAIQYIDPDTQVVLCAGAPDTKEIAAEMEQAVAAVKKDRDNVIWIDEMLDKPSIIQFYSHATVFCCPSIYEPFGIINIEAMACHTPVVASAVGGIKEVVIHEKTGLLIPVKQQQEAPFEPLDPDRFAQDLAAGINKVVADPELQKQMASAGRQRVEEHFDWKAIAQQTADLYSSLIA